MFGDVLRNSKIIRKSYFLSDKNFFRLLQIKGNLNTCIDLLKEKINKNLFLNSIIKDVDKKFIISKLSKREKNEIIGLADEICEHKFDLLGSGKVKVFYKLNPEGLEGFSYNMKISSEEFKEIKKKINDKIIYILESTDDTGINLFSTINLEYEPIDWHVDFKSGYRWNKYTFYKKVTYGDIIGADIKVPWELSRFQHLILLGQAYIITGDEKYSLEYIYQIVDWVENNSPQFGVNWKCTMDVAVRAANLILSLSFFKDSKLITEEFLFYFLKNIFIHGEHIVGNLEYYSVTSNHYLSDISGLIFIAEIFSDFNIGKKWKKFAVSELKKEMKKQVYNDGVDFEASTCYHRLVLELFFFPVLYTVRNSGDFDKINLVERCKHIYGNEFTEKLYRMFEFILFSLEPNGKLPQIGDNDNGRLFIFKEMEVLDMRYLLTLGAIFFKEPRFKVDEFGFFGEALWIFGAEGYRIWNSLDADCLNNIRSQAFPNTGWYIMRKGKNYMIISCGPNGQNGNGGHAHNDKLSYELFIGNKDIIVDPGSYIYTALPGWRNKFRSTSFHNTIMIDNQEQNRFKPDNLFSLENDSKVNVSKWETTPNYDYLEAEHNGYNRFYGNVTHKRQFVFNKSENYWLIKDILTGEGKHKFDLFFQLGPGMVYRIDKRTLTASIYFDDRCLKVIPLFRKSISLSVEEGWYSGRYGIKNKSKVLKYSRTSVLPVEFLFLMGLDNFIFQEGKISEIFGKFNV